jgi:hypothetical protein
MLLAETRDAWKKGGFRAWKDVDVASVETY